MSWEKVDHAEEYAQGMIDSHNMKETIKKAYDLGLLEADDVFMVIQQSLWEFYYNQQKEMESR